MADKPTNKDEQWRYAEKAMSWAGWGSPVGLGLFLLLISASIFLLREAGVF